jgi:bacterioferritin (cytochrome b1)
MDVRGRGYARRVSHFDARESIMATGETGFDDVTYDLISVQYHALKGGHDYGQYVRDAENAGEKEIADFFRKVMEEDSNRAHRCHEFLARLGGTDNTRPQQGPA